MTSRLPGWSNLGKADVESDEPRVRLASPAPSRVTEMMVDEAVAGAVESMELPSDVAAVMKHNLGRDTTSGVAHAYYTSKAVQSRRDVVGVARHNFTLRYALDDEAVADLTRYAPEFRITFLNVDSHDHSRAAGMRQLDHKLITMRLPYGVPFTDVGGDPIVYIWQGNDIVHVCGPDYDPKDAMRHKLRRLRAQRVLDSSEGAVRDTAGRYLASDETFCCRLLAQQCSYKSSILISVHVYDVPMQDWPGIMERKGASLVEGCLLFSNKFFDETQGELTMSGARYEIDVKADKFRMGFTGSPSWWYEHEWSKYMLYATDQVLFASGTWYSYKVVERRGDTLFFRILKLGGRPYEDKRYSSYSSPLVPVVKVEGFELSQGSAGGPVKHKTYLFPKNLWFELVSQASEDFERGVLDFTRMFNHYRTMSVKQTINAVLVMGGDQVSADELVPLVVHACLAAAAQSLLGQRTTRGITDAVMAARYRASESTGRKLYEAIAAASKAAILAPLGPFRWLLQAIKQWNAQLLEEWILQWEPVPEVVTCEAKLLIASSATAFVREQYEHFDVAHSAAVAQAPFDQYTAIVSNPELSKIFQEMCPQADVVQSPVSKGNTSKRVSQIESEVRSERSATVVPPVVSEAVQAIRLAAIREHIEEVEMQNRATAFSAAKAYRAVSLRGEPSEPALRKYAELYKNPDMWEVREGVIIKSALGIPASDFAHSAVYSPVPDPDTGATVRSVFRREWRGEEERRGEVQVHRVLSDERFSGWVLTFDELVVHNGPEILAALRASLEVPHEYTVVVHRGPPGCGKTYSIVHSVNPDGSDVISCPVRESMIDTRAQVAKLHPSFPEPHRLRMRTVDSYLTNRESDKRTAILRAMRLLADECYMTHSARWYAKAGLLGVQELHAWGDEKQIPHIPRVQAPKLYVKIQAQQEFYEWICRRCPPSAVAAWGDQYDWKVRSNKPEGCPDVLVEVRDTVGRDIPKGCVMMGMYQADKLMLRKKYAQHLKHIKVMTAHEAEGKTFTHVWLHRFDNRKRSDKFSLYDQSPHVLVAMSRHTNSFVYVCPGDLGDLVSSWIKRGQDVRRVAAVRDLGSAGQSKEFA
jgi:hypothetical protein